MCRAIGRCPCDAPRVGSATLAALRSNAMKIFLLAFAFLAAGIVGADDSINKRDIVYSRVDQSKCTLDFMRPAGQHEVATIVLVHGGAWSGGDKSGLTKMAADLVAEGFAVANVNYRLSGDATYPAAVHDVKAAVRWVRAQSSRFSLDPERVVGAGFSAGGHLISMLATTPGKIESKDVWPNESSHLNAAIVSGAGVDQVARIKATKSGVIKSCTIFFGGTFSEVPDLYEEGSPITHVSAETAPFLFLDGELDNPGKRYVAMREKLDDAGVAHELQVIPNAKHGQWGKSAFRPLFVRAIADYANTVGQ